MRHGDYTATPADSTNPKILRCEMASPQISYELDHAARARPLRVKAGKIPVPRSVLFLLLIGASTLVFRVPLQKLLYLCLTSPEYSYIVLIPVMVVGLLFVERGRIFEHVKYSAGAGLLITLAGVATSTGTLLIGELPSGTPLPIQILGLVVTAIGAFVLCYGTKALRAGLFVLLLSLLLVPLPHAVISKPIEVVQHGSVDVAGFLFRIAGVPVFHQGLTFSLPRLSIVVATQCSGIHSTLALFVASLLAGHFYFKSTSKPVVLVLVVLPIVCFTNGLRIFVLAMLASYVDMAFITGNLHKRGGALFFALALMLLGAVIKILGGRLPVQRRLQSHKGALA
jgi:exosortase